jgi:hypothetical protein
MRDLRFSRYAVMPPGRYLFHEQFVSAGVAAAADAAMTAPPGQ